MLEFTWMYLNLSDFIWICLFLPEFTRICLNLPEFTQIYLNLPELTWIYLNLPEWSLFCPLGFTWVHMVWTMLIWFDLGWSGVILEALDAYTHTYTHTDIFPISRDPIRSNNPQCRHKEVQKFPFFGEITSKAVPPIYDSVTLTDEWHHDHRLTYRQRPL